MVDRAAGWVDTLLPGVAVIQSASVPGRSAARGGRRAKPVQVLGRQSFQLPPLCESCDGYTAHAGRVIGARNRKVHPDWGLSSYAGTSQARFLAALRPPGRPCA